MKITIDRISLLRPLGQVQSVVERRNTIPILANVVLQAADGEVCDDGNRLSGDGCRSDCLAL